MGVEEQKEARAVWFRGNAAAFRCPKSIITAQSITFIEQFLYWKECGGDLWRLDARSADAMLVLKEQIAMENKNEEQKL